MTNTVLLKEAINASGYKLTYIAFSLNISRYTLTKKINNENEFKVSEMIALKSLLNLSDEKRDAIFFAQKVECSST